MSYYEKHKMTVFDHYASLILAGLIARDPVSDGLVENEDYKEIVRAAFEIADIALRERTEYGIDE